MSWLSELGDWAEKTYNNAKTALSLNTSTTSSITPSTYITGTGGYTTPTVNSNGISSDITASVGNSSTSSSAASSIYQTAEEKANAEAEAIYGTTNSDDSSSSKSTGDSSSSTTKTPSSYITGNNTTTAETGYNNIPTQYATTAEYDAAAWRQKVIENIQKTMNALSISDYLGDSLKVDGDFGEKTQSAWDTFIAEKGLDNYLANVSTAQTKTTNYPAYSYYGNTQSTPQSTLQYPIYQTDDISNSYESNAETSALNKLMSILGLGSSVYGASEKTAENIYNVAGIKNLNLNGKSSPKISTEDLQNLQKESNNWLSEKLYSDVDIVANTSGGYTLKQTADFADAYKNYDFNSYARNLDIVSIDDYITSKGFTKTIGTSAVREIEISSSSYKILNSVDDVADIVKNSGKAVPFVDKVLTYGGATIQVGKDLLNKGDFEEETFEAVGSAVIDSLGGAIGAKAGAAIGATIGSVVPVVGTVVGGVVGGIIGGVAGSMIGNEIGEWAGSKAYDMVY